MAFESAARLGSFAEAAKALGLTPSAISHRIRLLEARLGTALFSRRAGRSTLTPAGRLYAAEIGASLARIGAATATLTGGGRQETLTIACGPSFAAKWLQPRLPEFLGQFPEIRLRLATLGSGDAVDGARFDLAICYGDGSGVPGAEKLVREHIRPLCSPAVARRLRAREPADLLRGTLIHSTNVLSWEAYLRRFGVVAAAPRELWFDRSSLALDAARGGLGIVLESDVLAGAELRGGDLVAPLPDPAHAVDLTTYHLIRGRRPRASAVRFEAWLRAELRGN